MTNTPLFSHISREVNCKILETWEILVILHSVPCDKWYILLNSRAKENVSENFCNPLYETLTYSVQELWGGMPQNQHFSSILIKEVNKKFRTKTWLIYWKKIKSVYNRKRTFSKASNSSFSDCPFCSSFKFFDTVLSTLKTANFNLSENA